MRTQFTVTRETPMPLLLRHTGEECRVLVDKAYLQSARTRQKPCREVAYMMSPYLSSAGLFIIGTYAGSWDLSEVARVAWTRTDCQMFETTTTPIQGMN